MKKENVKVKKPFKKGFLRILFVFTAVIVFLLLAGAIFWVSVDYDIDLISIENISSKNIFFDNNSEEIKLNGNGRFIEFKEFKDYTINCFVATEDKNFFSHNGIDLKRITKATLKNVKSFSYKEGASTITQQLIKNSQLTNEKTISRKYKEIKLALKLEKHLSKERIMELYLNSIYFGKNCYGIENASLYYFNKSSVDLTLNESAVLAGIINSPAKFSPINNTDNCLNRRNLVLKNMLNCNYIAQDTYLEEISKPLNVDLTNNDNKNYTYMEAVNDELEKIFNLSEKEIAASGLKIYTYLDSNLQTEAAKILKYEEYFPEYYENVSNCIVLIDNYTNGISVLASNNGLNIKNVKRQPGSAVKPLLVYMPAFEKNIITATTLINDEKTDFEGYNPSNFHNEYYGDVTVRYAIKKSLNIPAVKTLNYIGVESFKDYAKKLNINLSESDNSLPLALGGLSEGINLIELTSGYTALSNNGEYGLAKTISKIEDKDGNVLYENRNSKTKVFSKENSFIMTDILMDAVNDGTASKLSVLPFEIASKTGTVGFENGNTDGYNISYTTRHTLGVWAGTKTGTFGQQIMGGTSCSFIAKDFYEKLYKNDFPPNFAVPENVTMLKIDSENLKVNHEIALAAKDTPDVFITSEYFSKNNMPKNVSTFFSDIKVTSADINIFDKYPKIKFTALPYASYEIYRDSGNNKELIETVKNKNGIVEITDKNVKEGKTYRYSIIPYFNSSKEKKKIEKGEFVSEKIIIPLKFVPKKEEQEKKNEAKDDEGKMEELLKKEDWWQLIY